MRRLTTIVVFAMAACGAPGDMAELPYYRTAELTPEWLGQPEATAPAMHRIGDFVFTDQRGRRITRSDVEGRVYVANFFYTACTQICPTMRAQLGRVAEALGDDVVLISHSITPEQDSVERLARYADAQGITEQAWHLVTGDPDEIRSLARVSYFVELEDLTTNTAGALMHTETMVLVDWDGRIRGVYNGTMAYDVNQLIEDARVLVLN